MKRQLAFAIAVVASRCLCAAYAAEPPDFNTTHGLYRLCTDPSQVQQSYCLGFVAGVAAALRASTALLEGRGVHESVNWCGTDRITHEQKVQAFRNWHDQHSEHWQDAPELGVIAALQATWPCPASHIVPPPDQH